MKALSTIAFGAAALAVATFADTAPAAADNVGVYVGSDGLAISVSNYRDGRYYYPRRACWNYQYRRHHPRLCHRIYRHVYRHHRRHDRWADRHDRRDDRRHDRRRFRRYRDPHRQPRSRGPGNGPFDVSAQLAIVRLCSTSWK